MTEKTEAKTDKAEAAAPAVKPEVAEQAAEKKIYVHQMQIYLVGGQTFTINEVTNSPNMPNNVVAFINAWRQKRDVWHSPNNDPKFGVRVKDVSLYEYRVGVPKTKTEADVEPAKEVKKAKK